MNDRTSKRKDQATADRVAMAACRELVLSFGGHASNRDQVKRAALLARFALAMRED